MGKFSLLFSFVVFVTVTSFSQDSTNRVLLNKLPENGILLDKGWKFHEGDNPEWAKPEFDDREWAAIDPTKDIHELPAIIRSNIVWLRIKLRIDTTMNENLSLIIHQSGASEIFINGKLIHKSGILSTDPSNVVAYDPLWRPIAFAVKGSDQVIAVRYAVQPGIRYTTLFETPNAAFSLKIDRLQNALDFHEGQLTLLTGLFIFLIGVSLILAIIHLAFYIFYPTTKGNLYYGLYALVFMLGNIVQACFFMTAHVVKTKYYLGNISFDLYLISDMLMLTALYYLVDRRTGRAYKILWSLFVVAVVLNAGPYIIGWRLGGALFQVLVVITIVAIAINALKKKRQGAWIIVVGAISYVIFFILFITQGTFSNTSVFFLSLTPLRATFYIISRTSIPVATSLYLGLDFALISRTLKQKLSEVEELSQEKQEILANQNQLLEQQVIERTTALSKSLEELKNTQTQLIQKEKMASLGELTAGIAHEIQNPLNFVNNFSDVNAELIEELKSEKSKVRSERDEQLEEELLNDIAENEQKINHHGKRADAIVKGMLQHSRASSGKKEPTDINALADEYLRLSYHGLRAKDKDFNADFTTDFDQSIGSIEVVPQDIGRVLLNLYNNAFYAVNEKKKQLGGTFEPTVIVTTKRTGDKVEITVKDNGNGIPQKIVDKIFQPFFTTKPTGQGTGLGLSLSYDIVKAHGGDIKVESKEGKGSVFIIQLPLLT